MASNFLALLLVAFSAILATLILPTSAKPTHPGGALRITPFMFSETDERTQQDADVARE
jgi:hypothetical protein